MISKNNKKEKKINKQKNKKIKNGFQNQLKNILSAKRKKLYFAEECYLKSIQKIYVINDQFKYKHIFFYSLCFLIILFA